MSVIDDAILVGKFPEARRAHWERSMASDADSTSRLIARLEPVPGLKGDVPSRARGPIASAAGLPLTPHPLGGYLVEGGL